jgi:hypothetical protein
MLGQERSTPPDLLIIAFFGGIAMVNGIFFAFVDAAGGQGRTRQSAPLIG